jgi:hypothetical protein
MKAVDFAVLLVLAIGGFTSISESYDSISRDVLYSILLAGILIASERTAASIWKQADVISRSEVQFSKSLAVALPLCARQASLLLSFFVPTQQVLDGRSNIEDPIGLIRKSVPPLMTGVGILFVSLLLMLWLGNREASHGILGSLIVGTSFGLLATHLVTSFLAWWAISFAAFGLGFFIKR